MKFSPEQRKRMSVQSWSPLLYASLPDVLLICGAACVTYGAWLVFAPAGFIVGGALLICGGVLVSRKFE